MNEIMKLRIMGIDHEVVYQEEMRRINGCLGQFDLLKKVIRIDSAETLQEQKRVLLHEILEVIGCDMGLHLDHDTQLVKLEVGLFQVFSDNPHLLKYLLSEQSKEDSNGKKSKH